MRAGEYEIKAYEAGTYALLGTSNTIYMGPPRCSNHGDCSGSEYCDLDSQCYPCSECLFARDAIDHICPTKCGGIGEAVVGDRFPDLPEVRKSRAPLFFAYEYTKNLPPSPPKKKIQNAIGKCRLIITNIVELFLPMLFFFSACSMRRPGLRRCISHQRTLVW